MRPSWVEIDLGAIAHNVAALRDLVAPAAVCAVVKADGYGHGDVPVAEAALAAGAEWLAVALLEEGIRLREAGIEAPVLVLSEPDPSDAVELLHWGLTPTVYREEMIDALGEAAVVMSGVHLKINTGMHRVGAKPEDVGDLLARIDRYPLLALAGVFTHFASSDEDDGFTREQVERFDRATQGIEGPLVHMANTAGAILHPSSRRDLVRLGIGIYGLHPCDDTRPYVGLRPAMRIVSHVAFVQRLAAGERPSYGRRRELATDAYVATVPLGYADGVPRLLTDKLEVLIRGKRRSLAGTVTMDQIIVDVGDEEVNAGEEVILLGPQGDEEVTADEWSSNLGTISYEVVCQIGPRLPRRYES
ncbi:MAG TPA: alanine racemase [Acidimicrobiia bacterium]|nr:alanine racemase [Acidimicrobiia bacterium]